MLIVAMLPGTLGSGCRSNAGLSGGNGQQGNDLPSMETARVSILESESESEFEVWLAQSADQRQKGLMFVTQDELAPLEDGTRRGMLFIFAQEQILSFWMKDTIIPLDIAYADGEGTIVKTYTMTALDTSLYPSIEPARYALEVGAGVFEELGISEGDKLVIPK